MKRKSDSSNSTQPRAKRKKLLENNEDWPVYFQALFKVFKALNTTLAFISARKQIATTFPVIRSSVERLLKQPLKLSDVAELKALLPDLIRFTYITRLELQINSEQLAHRPGSPDFSQPKVQAPTSKTSSPEEHVLILEFVDNSRGKKLNSHQVSQSLSAPSTITPAATKKLIEKRNECFIKAVNDLLIATPSEDPSILLQSAARDHIPVDPNAPSISTDNGGKTKKLSFTIVPEPMDRPSIDEVLEEVQDREWYKDQIRHRRTVEAREGRTGALDPPLSESISRALKESRNITDFYTHQVAAIQALNRGSNVIVSTSTASGKSIIYQVPLLRALENDPDATAIFVYPTKALAQDQRASVEQLLCACEGLAHVKVSTYDGDTPQDIRKHTRETASVIFTNFDTIHASILPNEDKWRNFLKNMKIFAVDELHYYSGTFGTHVAQIMRRFRRVCAAVGNRRIRFISCSATIRSPLSHMVNIFGLQDREVEVVTDDGAPSGKKDYVIWDPPPIDEEQRLGKQSSISQATRLMSFLMARGVRTILFCKIRKVCELAMKTLRIDLSNDGRQDILERLSSYRGGYNQEDRRKIERDAFSGHLLGIVATNALELGVDIGVLDAVIMVGFPFTVASFRQQAGRAGRRSRDSLAVLVPDNVPIDNYFVEYPDELFDRPIDDLVVDLDNKVILEAHLQCAGQEMPLSNQDSYYFGPLMQDLCQKRLKKDSDGWFHTHPKYSPYPSRFIAIRGPIEEKYVVADITSPDSVSGGTAKLEEIEVSRAMFEIYEGGVWMHQGKTYITKEVDHDTKIAKVFRADVNWNTAPRDLTNVDATQTYRIREITGSPNLANYGRVDVQVVVFGFYKIRDKKILDAVDLETPPYEVETTGFWIDVPTPALELMREKHILPAEAIHSANHAFLNRFALAQDVRTECKNAEKEYMKRESMRKRPARLIFYDRHHSGGVAVKAFDSVSEILTKATTAVAECACEDGCYRCVQSSACKEKNVVCSKIGAKIILQSILGIHIDKDSIPDQLNEHPAAHDTIIPAVPAASSNEIEIERRDLQ